VFKGLVFSKDKQDLSPDGCNGNKALSFWLASYSSSRFCLLAACVGCEVDLKPSNPDPPNSMISIASSPLPLKGSILLGRVCKH
jgi:hypothetical protein